MVQAFELTFVSIPSPWDETTEKKKKIKAIQRPLFSDAALKVAKKLQMRKYLMEVSILVIYSRQSANI